MDQGSKGLFSEDFINVFSILSISYIDLPEKSCNTWGYGTSGGIHVRLPMGRQLIYFTHMTISRDPVRMITLLTRNIPPRPTFTKSRR